MPKPTYTIHPTHPVAELSTNWEGEFWKNAPSLNIDQFRPESSSFHPTVNAKLLYDANFIHVIFKVQDRYTVCQNTQYQSTVCSDSCVEFFVKPAGSKGYFNFEMNCGGTLLCAYITDHRRLPEGGYADFYLLTPEDGSLVRIKTTMPKKLDSEITGPTTWTLAIAIPFAMLTKHTGTTPTPTPDAPWTANFYKCADKSSHPHWASWSPVSVLNFHLPAEFGSLTFSP